MFATIVGFITFLLLLPSLAWTAFRVYVKNPLDDDDDDDD